VGDSLPCGRPVIDADIEAVWVELCVNTSLGCFKQPEQVQFFFCG
jgi:hypothetical protein